VTLAGFLAPACVYALITLLHFVLPARAVDGYVTDPVTREPYRYRLNGLAVFAIAMVLWVLACSSGLIAWDFFWTARWEGLAGACVLGLVFTLAIVLCAPRTGNGLIADLYFGRLENPQWLGKRIDTKMWLYLAGAVMLELNLASFAMHHALAFPSDPSPGVWLYAGLFTFFLGEYLFFERVHLYTYDFLAERVGFKLGWGCLVFYPYFYCVGLWSVATLPNPHAPAALLAAAALVFFSGWCLARGANMQKYLFKRDASAKFLGLIPAVALSDGENKLLVSGFWGVARHVNYLGEFLMAIGLTLALGYPGRLGPWLYPLYYVALLLPRQIDDDRRCALKYGALWKAYVARVPWRIVPGLY
jgi:protein-S-isoprenylcysteine O-methyltransferase Ste14